MCGRRHHGSVSLGLVTIAVKRVISRESVFSYLPSLGTDPTRTQSQANHASRVVSTSEGSGRGFNRGQGDRDQPSEGRGVTHVFILTSQDAQAINAVVTGLHTPTCHHFFFKEFFREAGCTRLSVSYGYTNRETLLVRDGYHFL